MRECTRSRTPPPELHQEPMNWGAGVKVARSPTRYLRTLPVLPYQPPPILSCRLMVMCPLVLEPEHQKMVPNQCTMSRIPITRSRYPSTRSKTGAPPICWGAGVKVARSPVQSQSAPILSHRLMVSVESIWLKKINNLEPIEGGGGCDG